jgi:AcrR family transcriptional regulator
VAVAAPSGAKERRDARVERRRERIGEAALYLFATRGYNITSVEEIVARAKMSKSAFYEFFTSKEHCFRELLAEEGGALMREVLAEAATGHSHRERLRLGITRFVHSCFERPSVARVLIVESIGISAGVDQVRHDLQGQFAAAAEEEVRHARLHDPVYADKDPELFGRAVVGSVTDSVAYYLTHPGADAEALARSLCGIFAP